jgi:DNA-binding XRE family transcriptional regulator
MPFVNVTDIVLNEEARELEEAYNNNPKVKAAIDQFEAECKLRRELIDARKAKNMTQAQIQERSGLTQQIISRIESNTEISPSLKNLMIYANALDYELALQPKGVSEV